jgi:hypothetical protein
LSNIIIVVVVLLAEIGICMLMSRNDEDCILLITSHGKRPVALFKNMIKISMEGHEKSKSVTLADHYLALKALIVPQVRLWLNC